MQMISHHTKWNKKMYYQKQSLVEKQRNEESTSDPVIFHLSLAAGWGTLNESI